jgi:hypothetical protein
MADFREYVSLDAEPEPNIPELNETDRSKQLAEVARQVFYVFAIESPPIYPFTECVEAHSDRGFTVRVYMVGENFGAKIVLHASDTMEAGQVHAPGTPVNEIVLGLLESCRTVIYRDYHPDPNMHECLWTRHHWSKKGRKFLEIIKSIESIPRIRRLHRHD